MKTKPFKKPARGFALIVTLSLMILLTVIAVGLLTLSSISLRSASQSDSMAVARANAKLALMLAIGELQKSAGPDKSITATSEIVAESPGKPNLTGVWESTPVDPLSPPNYETRKDDAFRSWLVSSTSTTDVKNRTYPVSAYTGDTIELAGDASLGGAGDAKDKIFAGKVSLTKNSKKNGAFAWHVADEGVKARINSYRDPSQNSTLWQKRALLAGHRPNIAQISLGTNKLDFLPSDENIEKFQKAFEVAGKLISLDQGNLFGSSSTIKRFRNVVTPYSLGLLTDSRNGGLKQDLTSLFELGVNMPAPYAENTKLYASTQTLSGGVSDPYWSTLSSYYNLYKEITTPESQPTLYKAPEESVAVTTISAPKKFLPAPVIAKVESIFTFVVRDAHEHHAVQLKAQDPQKLYMGHLVYIPLVTLHNPYNVNLKFDRFKITMKNVPVGFVFYVNEYVQNLKPTPINEMFTANGGGSSPNKKGEKSFTIEIANWSSPTSTSPSGQITMKPGQTLVCGPYVSPTSNWTTTFDWRNGTEGVNQTGTQSVPMKSKPGFLGHPVGFGIDWLTPHDSVGFAATTDSSDNNMSVLGLKGSDMIRIESSLLQPTLGVKDRFEVSAEMTANGKKQLIGGLNFVYQNQDNLNKVSPEKLRFPNSGSKSASSMYEPNSKNLVTQLKAQAFSIFSVYGRTANGGVYETGKRVPTKDAANELRDGRLAGTPFLFHNPAKAVSTLKLATEKPGFQSHEMNFQSLPGNTEDMFDSDDLNRTFYLLSNKKAIDKSIKSGSYLEIPTGPMQSIADFRRSNALTSSYLPNFTQPVGNSYVSPMMSTTSVSETGITDYALLDHSYLANQALYDRFYFSTFAPKNSMPAKDVFRNFMEKKEPLVSQAFQPHLPSGQTLEKAELELFSGALPTQDAYKLASSYQMVRGAFNVNSTNVQAWKAMLSSLDNSELATLWAKSGGLANTKSVGTPITAMSLINGGLATNSTVVTAEIDDKTTNEWNGYRELSPAQLDTLAAGIVKQVRDRGPFLSLSEFVNRRIGSESDLTMKGALQQAIDESKINNSVLADQVALTVDDISDKNVYDYKTPKVMEGNPAAGAPGWISQGDLMKILEPAATVRSDTFVIRACGEAVDATGKVTARAYVEAVLQRTPEYVNPVDAPTVNVYEVATSASDNKLYGRRFEMVSFRWLSAKEI